MPAPRDSSRERLYKAERRAFAGELWAPKANPLPIVFCQQFVNRKILNSAWFQREFPHLTRITIRHGKGGGHAYVHEDAISLGVMARTVPVLLHEVAHIAAHERYRSQAAPHGREFAWIYLELVKRFIGKDAHDRLRLEFIRGDVPFILPKNRLATRDELKVRADADRLKKYAARLGASFFEEGLLH